MGLFALGLLYSALHAFTAALLGMVADDREVCDTVRPASLLRMRGGSGWGPPSHLGGSRLGKGADVRDIHPESGPDEGPAIMLPGLQVFGCRAHFIASLPLLVFVKM